MIEAGAGTFVHAIGVDGVLTVRTGKGDVRLTGVAGDTVRIRADDGDDLGGLEVIAGTGSLAIGAAPGAGDGPRGSSSDLDIEVPCAASVIVEATSGDIRAGGLVGDQRYQSASGDIDLEVRGSLTVEAVAGDIGIATDGEVAASLRTVSGDIVLRAGIIASLRATTTSGDVRFEGRFDGPGPFEVATVSGDAAIAPIGDLRVEATSVTGGVHATVASRREDGHGRRVLTIGAGKPTLTFQSMSGDLAVERSRGHSPAIDPAADPAADPESTIDVESSVDVDGDGDGDGDRDAERLRVLQALERDEIDLAEATRRLASIDD